MRRMTIVGNTVLVNSGFLTRNNLSENNPQFGQAPPEFFGSHVLGRKFLKNIGLSGAEFFISPGGPHVSGRPW
jgi:hypothetical protein